MVSALVDINDYGAAEELARTIPSPSRRARALGTVAAAVASAGDHDRAHRLVAQAQEAIHTIGDDGSLAYASAKLARVMATTGEHALARRLAIEADRVVQASGRQLLAEAWARLGEPGHVERVARTSSTWDIPALTAAVCAATAAGRHRVALLLAVRAETAIHTTRNPDEKPDRLCELAVAMLGARKASAVHPTWPTVQVAPTTAHGRAFASRLVTDAMASRRTDDSGWWSALSLAALGQFDQARAVANNVPDSHAGNRVEILSELAQVAAGAGEIRHARLFVADAASSMRDYMWQYAQAQDLVRAMLAAELHADAEQVATNMNGSLWEVRVLGEVLQERWLEGTSTAPTGSLPPHTPPSPGAATR
jgi:hypothetical protein